MQAAIGRSVQPSFCFFLSWSSWLFAALTRSDRLDRMSLMSSAAATSCAGNMHYLDKSITRER